MRPSNRFQPGWFFKDESPYLALSHVPKVANMTAIDVECAITTGDLTEERVAGCKAIALQELIGFLERRAILSDREKGGRA
jgi:hypothetical protein